jgi:hypothetical protein
MPREIQKMAFAVLIFSEGFALHISTFGARDFLVKSLQDKPNWRSC